MFNDEEESYLVKKIDRKYSEINEEKSFNNMLFLTGIATAGVSALSLYIGISNTEKSVLAFGTLSALVSFSNLKEAIENKKNIDAMQNELEKLKRENSLYQSNKIRKLK